MVSFLPLTYSHSHCELHRPNRQACLSISCRVNLETGAGCACSQLASSYPDQILFPHSADYTTQAINYWDARSELRPACIFLPSSADQVSDGIGLFSKCGAQFGYPGSNNIYGGVLLALDSSMDYRFGNETITVRSGMTWNDVYSALEPYGRVAVGGRLKTIEVPGLMLIGGVSYLSNKYRSAMDNVVDYEVVLGNGTKITASATSHPDLFWTLKGGANNFAVVTIFRLQTFSMPYISMTIQQFNETGIYVLVRASCDLVLVDDDASTAAGVVLTITYNVTAFRASEVILSVQEGISNRPSRFANFTAIPGTSKQWASNLDSPKQMFRIVFGNHSMYPDADVFYSMFKTWTAAVAQTADIQGLYPTFVINLSPASAASVVKTNQIGNTWGLSEEPLICKCRCQVTTGWDHHLVEHRHANNKRNGLARAFIYMGFPAENVQRMRDIRQIYDPSGTFPRLNWGGFKLGY
ncbi:FAD binding domain protein [Aspergillus nidulans var. acristatus]